MSISSSILPHLPRVNERVGGHVSPRVGGHVSPTERGEGEANGVGRSKEIEGDRGRSREIEGDRGRSREIERDRERSRDRGALGLLIRVVELLAGGCVHEQVEVGLVVPNKGNGHVTCAAGFERTM